MIDLARLRQEPAALAQAWQHRGLEVDVDALVAMDAEVRQLKQQAESIRAEANQASKAIGKVAKEGGDIAAAREAARALGDQAKDLNDQREQLEKDLQDKILELPNPCLPEVPVGHAEKDNVVLSTWGELPDLGEVTPQPHWEIAAERDWIDFERGAHLSGSGFVVYKGLGARLNRALISWFLDTLTERFGYTELGVPLLVRPEVMTGTGQLPKFADQLYHTADDDLYLVPTAEVPVTNYLSGEILTADQLPQRFTAYTPCFRREAGAAGVGTRGITRMHQFDKVEMVMVVHPDESQQAFAELRSHAEYLLQQLGLHYRALDLCTGDTGFSSAHTIDYEVWSAGTGTWLEVSSCSIFTDFQARRIPLRFRREAGAKPEPVHTLNGSGLALPRTLIAILESNLQSDGRIAVPKVLQPYLGGDEFI